MQAGPLKKTHLPDDVCKMKGSRRTDEDDEIRMGKKITLKL